MNTELLRVLLPINSGFLPSIMGRLITMTSNNQLKLNK